MALYPINQDGISSKPLYDTWQPKFAPLDLVVVESVKEISPKDKWVVDARLVDEDKEEWFYLRPGNDNRSGLRRIKVQGEVMRKISKFS